MLHLPSTNTNNTMVISGTNMLHQRSLKSQAPLSPLKQQGKNSSVCQAPLFKKFAANHQANRPHSLSSHEATQPLDLVLQRYISEAGQMKDCHPWLFRHTGLLCCHSQPGTTTTTHIVPSSTLRRPLQSTMGMVGVATEVGRYQACPPNNISKRAYRVCLQICYYFSLHMCFFMCF